jgi:hypothetical protein
MIWNETALLVLLLIFLLIVAFTLLSLSLSRHYSDVTNKRQRLSQNFILLFRLVGYGFLLASVTLSVSLWGLGLGLVYCFGTATVVVILLSMILTFKPKWLLFIPLLFTD